MQWSHSGSWEPPSLRTWSGTLTSTPLWKRPSRECTFFVNWKSSTCHRRTWQFYSAVIESVLCSSITVWFGSASKSDIRRLQRTVRTAERIIGVHLPSLQDLYYSRVKKRAGTSSQIPLTLDTTCLRFSLQADATDLCALEHLGIKTVFSPMPSPA